jgi:hypothetical protein
MPEYNLEISARGDQEGEGRDVVIPGRIRVIIERARNNGSRCGWHSLVFAGVGRHTEGLPYCHKPLQCKTSRANMSRFHLYISRLADVSQNVTIIRLCDITAH